MEQVTRPAPAPGRDTEVLQDQIVAALRQVYDPEIPVNIYDMGLIYKIDIDPESLHVHLDMTLTSPNCPAAQFLPAEVQARVEEVPDVSSVNLEIVWEPQWDMSRMSEEAQLELGLI